MDQQSSPQWQSALIEKILLATVAEQRAKRRWGIFFKLFFISAFIGAILFATSGDGGPGAHAKHHTAVIKIDDDLDADSEASAEAIIPALIDAFKNPYAEAIILELNSPGGSPVQAGEIYDEIIRLKGLHPNKKVYGVITETCASGCYYLASAADMIYANEASLVGSIGVLYDGFGAVGIMEKVGIQRRLITAGKNKAFLDPFMPLSPEHEAFMHDLLSIVHTQFINKVKAGRGDRLKNDPNLFTGLVWTGQQSVDMGLIDGLGSVRKVAAEIIGEPTLIDYTQGGGFFSNFTPKKIGMSLRDVFFSTDEGLKLR